MKTITTVEEFWEIINAISEESDKKIEHVKFKGIHVHGGQSEAAADLHPNILNGISFKYCDFKDCVFNKICLSACEFVCCKFYLCRFNSMIFVDGSFVYNDLNYCDFHTCNLKRFDIVSSSMVYVEFAHSRLDTSGVFYCSKCAYVTIKESKIDIRIGYSNIHDLNINDCHNKDIDLKLFCSTIHILKFIHQDSYPRSIRIENCGIGDIVMNGNLLRIVQVSGIGSRKACTMYDAANDHVVCGCWSTKNGEITGGSLDEFEKRVNESYPINPDERSYFNFYRKEYMNTIELFKTERERYKEVNESYKEMQLNKEEEV